MARDGNLAREVQKVQVVDNGNIEQSRRRKRKDSSRSGIHEEKNVVLCPGMQKKKTGKTGGRQSKRGWSLKQGTNALRIPAAKKEKKKPAVKEEVPFERITSWTLEKEIHHPKRKNAAS